MPDFFVIGAAKCGTSSLHLYLDQHPQVSMSLVKEPGVFSRPLYLRRYENYDGLFDCSARRRGESSTSYTRYPAEGDAAPRIREAVPEAKLIYLVRDPVDRIVSDYIHHHAAGHERRSLDDAVKDFSDPGNFYVSTSRYGMQIRRYLEYFDVSSVLVVEQRDLKDSREQTIRQVFNFLGVDANVWSREFEVELLKREDYVRPHGVAARLRQTPAGRWYRRLPVRRRLPIARAARRLAGAVPQARLDPVLRAELADFLRPEVDDLRLVTGTPREGLSATVAG